MLILLVAAAFLPASQEVSAPVLTVGEAVTGDITDADPQVDTGMLGRYDSPTVGRRFWIDVEESGPCSIELRSYFFDPYLVLRDERGSVLAEDDDGLISVHSRIPADLVAGRRYLVEACALHGQRGGFELALSPGRPGTLSATERAVLDLEDGERRLAVVEAARGPEHPDTAFALYHLGVLLQAQGDLAAARPRLERALAIYEIALGPRDLGTTSSLNHLVAVLQALGDHSTAYSLLERVGGDWNERLGRDDPATALIFNHLAGMLRRSGNLAAARPLYERALAIRDKALGPEHADTAKSLNNLAALLVEQGDYSAARPLYERALAIRDEVLGPEHADTAVSFNNLASLLFSLGDYGSARPLYERALAIQEKTLGPQDPGTASTLQNLALLLCSQGDYGSARSLHERGLAINEKAFGPEHPDTANSLNNLASLLRIQGQAAVARPMLERALAINERALGPEHPITSVVLNNLALAVREQGDLEASRRLSERAMSIQEKRLGPEHPLTALSLVNLAGSLWVQGDYTEGQRLFERGLAAFEKNLGAEHPDTGVARARLALLLADRGAIGSAWELLSAGRDASRRHMSGMVASLSETESYAYLAANWWQLEAALSIAAEHPDPVVQKRSYEQVLAWKGQVARQLQRSRGALRSRLSPEASELLGRLQGVQLRLSTLALGREDRDPAAQAEHLRQLREQRNQHELDLVRAAGSTIAPDPAFAELALSLPERSISIDFLVHDVYRPARRENGQAVEPGAWQGSRLSAWITRPGAEAPVHLDLGEAAPIERAIRDWLGAIVQHPASSRGVSVEAASNAREASAAGLRERLWEPLTGHLAGIELVFLSLDSFLGTLPFEVIALADGHFPLEERSFVYLENPAALGGIAAPRSREISSLLVVGGVDYGRQGAVEEPTASAAAGPLREGVLHSWTGLPHTSEEARFISALHAGAFGDAGERVLLQGERATEERLKEELPKHSVVHLATHGFFQPADLPSLWEAARARADEEREGLASLEQERRALAGYHPGLLSGLVCAGANLPAPKEHDDGLLTAEEVGWLDLSEVELLVLSACETALGEARSGEGMLGLTRAFRTAGVETVVSSLWSVKDESTRELMQRFYRNLWQHGMGKHAALRAAQLETLQINRARGDPDPASWGAFVLMGEWR